MSPDGRRVYVSNSNSDSFSVIDAQDRAVLTTVPAGLDPEGLTLDKSGTTVLSPDGRWVVVSKPTTTLKTANQSYGARISAVLKQIGRPHAQTVVRTQIHEGPSPWPRG